MSASASRRPRRPLRELISVCLDLGVRATGKLRLSGGRTAQSSLRLRMAGSVDLELTLACPQPDKKCPFTGLVSIRGRILTGTVVSTKMHRTVIVRREYLHYIPKYDRYEKRHKNFAAHVSPAFRVEEGDQVTVGQCRPLSKTVCRPAAASCVTRCSTDVLMVRLSP